MLLAVVGLWLLLQVSASSDVTLKNYRAVSHVRQVSDSDVIPILANKDAPLTVTLSVSLINIADVDTYGNQVELLLWLGIIWQNKALAWDLNGEGFNVTYVNVPADYLWLPDITVYSAVSNPEITTPRIARVDNNGAVFYDHNLLVRVPCNLEGLDSEQGANCTVKLSSWTYRRDLLTISRNSFVDLEGNTANPRYEIAAINYFNAFSYYPCCSEPYEDFKFSFLIKSVQDRNQWGSVVGAN